MVKIIELEFYMSESYNIELEQQLLNRALRANKVIDDQIINIEREQLGISVYYRVYVREVKE